MKNGERNVLQADKSAEYGSCWQVGIGIMGRMQVPSVRMRITIAGIRIRISAVSSVQIQGFLTKLLAGFISLALTGKIQDGEIGWLVVGAKVI